VHCLGAPSRDIVGESPVQQLNSSSDVRKITAESRRRRVILVGIPGVGKSTIVNKILDFMHEQKLDAEVVNFGTIMMEEARERHKLKSRDEMRQLPVEAQRKLQIYAARRISEIEKQVVVIDTHLFIATREGFWPGIPMDVLQALRPTHIVFVSATLAEIKSRRENDTTRARDMGTLESLELEMEAARSLLYASSLVCGCPALTVHNSTGKPEEAAKSIIDSVF
jgi:adenylate kinase